MSLMTEIQLRRIVDRLSLTESEEEQATDVDEFMVKDGHTISKFSKSAMHIESVHDDENWEILRRINAVCDNYVGPDSVFPLKNGAPRIMTKFKDNPYSYELLPEYASGLKAMPSVKSINWFGKTAHQTIVRGFIRPTPVVEKYNNPMCVSRLVIVPKLAPGQSKDDPEHGFRVCVNALVNKCLKPCASTIPLATDEIIKLHGMKYYLQADGDC